MGHGGAWSEGKRGRAGIGSGGGSFGRPAPAFRRQSRRDFGPGHAETDQAALRHSPDLIAANPRLGRKRGDIAPPVRIHPSGAHVVVHVAGGDEDVTAVGFRHGREDWVGEPG
jgi:toxin ParE1/3/4